MSAKNLDKHNRWRNKTVAFRVSPEEDAQIETAVKLTGLTKQDYIIRQLLCRDVVVQGNPRVYKALRDQLAAVLDELMDNVFEGKSVVIENLLYTGAYILAGTPKIGKSFLVAQLAHHVSTGQDLWGYKVHQGTVLNLALEDDESRLQCRMFHMFGVERTSSLHFATNAKMIGGGLDEQLEKFVREYGDTKLIIVDTLQKVREAVNDSYSYFSDYEVIGKLKQFADRYGVCVLIVHHTRKQPAEDSFEMISGTTGSPSI